MRILGLSTIVALVAVSGWAQEALVKVAKPETTAQYLDRLQVKLEHTARRANQPHQGSANVIGVRGAEQVKDSEDLYWKGTAKTPVSTDEVRLYRSAVEQARAGKTDEAVKILKSFQEKFPKSALSPDVQETLTRLTPVTPAK